MILFWRKVVQFAGAQALKPLSTCTRLQSSSTAAQLEEGYAHIVWKRDSASEDASLEPDPNDYPRVPPIPILARIREGMGRFADEPVTILGIETSCDDTAVGVVDVSRRILGQAKASQTKEHKAAGGVIPRVARRCHKENIESVTNAALEQSGRSLDEVGGIAVTVCPGMKQCLEIGMEHAKELARKANKPLIPIHHMEAHALTARLKEDIPFPHLVLLCSGGHCILVIAEHVNQFSVLGSCLDESPGTTLDQCARMMRLNLHPDVAGLPGGVAIEKLAQKGNAENVTIFKKKGSILATHIHPGLPLLASCSGQRHYSLPGNSSDDPGNSSDDEVEGSDTSSDISESPSPNSLRLWCYR